jgi:hypothetical protein
VLFELPGRPASAGLPFFQEGAPLGQCSELSPDVRAVDWHQAARSAL